MNSWDVLLENVVMLNSNDLKDALKNIQEGIFPNVKLPTLGGKVCWDTIAEYRGWKIQKNMLTARILDDKSYCIAWGTVEGMRKALERISVPWKRCKAGDILAISRFGGIYQHFAVYIGNGRVIHYAAESGDFGNPYIHEANFEDFLGGSTSFDILSFPEEYSAPEHKNIDILASGALTIPSLNSIGINEILWGTEYHLYSPTETIERARQRLGETEYNLAMNNCEHFAIWCKTGIKESKQVDRVLHWILGYGLTEIVRLANY